jgi:hypothetical protein
VHAEVATHRLLLALAGLEPHRLLLLHRHDANHRRYGDLAPTGNGAKLATVAIQLSGIGLFVLLLSEVARRSLISHETEPTDSSSGPESA